VSFRGERWLDVSGVIEAAGPMRSAELPRERGLQVSGAIEAAEAEPLG
jgi:hypothetical protein